MATFNAIQLGELRDAAEILLANVEAVHGKSVEVDDDYFWSIPPESLYNVYEEPTELTIGQVSEAMQHTRQMVEGEHEPLAYHLVWLSDVLRAVGHGLTR